MDPEDQAGAARGEASRSVLLENEPQVRSGVGSLSQKESSSCADEFHLQLDRFSECFSGEGVLDLLNTCLVEPLRGKDVPNPDRNTGALRVLPLGERVGVGAFPGASMRVSRRGVPPPQPHAAKRPRDGGRAAGMVERPSFMTSSRGSASVSRAGGPLSPSLRGRSRRCGRRASPRGRRGGRR